MPRRGSIVIHVPDIVYVFVNGQDYTTYALDYSVKKELNQAAEFKVKFIAIPASKRSDFAEGKEIKFIFGSSLFLRGKIQRSTYSTTYDVEVEGFGWGESILKERLVEVTDSCNKELSPVNRPFYENVPIQTIVSEQLAGTSISIDPINNGSDLGTFTGRGDMINKLSFLAQLAESVNAEWWFDYGSAPSFSNVVFNIARRKGSSSAVVNYNISGSNVNAVRTANEKDFNALWNDVTAIGYGDGVNQIKSRIYHATNSRTTTLGDLPKNGTVITGVDFSSFPNSGNVWIGEEKVTYASRTNSTLDDCTRWVSGTSSEEGSFRIPWLDSKKDNTEVPESKKYIHYSGVAVYDAQYTPSSPEAGSSIATYGIKEHIVTDRRVVDQHTLDIAAQTVLDDHYQLVERNNVSPATFHETVSSLDTGDTVNIEDSESGLSGESRVKVLTLKNDSGYITVDVETSNSKVELMRDIAGASTETGILGKFMQGSTTTSQISVAENCDSNAQGDFPLNIRFYIPEDVIGINKALLNLKQSDFRGYARGVGHFHTIPSLSVNAVTSTANSSPGYGQSSALENSYSVTANQWNNTVSITAPSGSCHFAIAEVFLKGDTVASQSYFVRVYNSSTSTYYPVENSGFGVDVDNESGASMSFVINGDISGDTLRVDVYPRSSNDNVQVFLTCQTIKTHTHTVTGATTVADTTNTAIGLQYGINVSGVATTPTYSIDVGVDGSEVPYKTNLTGDLTNEDITTFVQKVAPGNWANVKITPSGPMRLEGNLYLRFFVTSR